MVGDYNVSPDKLTYRFKLRDGLAFHDSSPVRGVDCVASIRRWAARDALGQWLVPLIDTIAADGPADFTIKLKEPFPLLIDGLAKVSTLPSFVMPERLANTDPFQQVTEMVGSGPFKFVKGGVRTLPPGGLSEERGLCAAPRAAKLGGGRQASQGRSGRMA
jgi:peptide/nickel transport system substrate-binding protein